MRRYRRSIRATLVALGFSSPRRAIAIAIGAVAIAAAASAQPLPDDQPTVPRWSERVKLADSLLLRGWTAEAIDVLEELRGAPAVRARSEDYPRLLLRLARAYALRGDIDRSLERVVEVVATGYVPLHDIERSEEFALVRRDPRFAELIAGARTHLAPWDRIWRRPGGLEEWSDTLALAQRMYGLSSFWSSVKVAYAYVDRLGGRDWDSAYLAAIEETAGSSSTLAYYRLVQRLAALLGDGHTSVLIPPELIDSVGFYPPVRTRLVEDRVVVTGVLEPLGIGASIEAGDEIVSIDGVPPALYVERSVAPWISASSPQDMRVRCYDHFLLAGPVLSTVQLVVRDAGGTLHPCYLERTWCRDEFATHPTVEHHRLGADVGYIAINSFDDEYVVPLFELALRSLGEMRALVIDLRENTGGQSRLAFDVLARLMVPSFQTHRWETPMYRSYFHARGRSVEWHTEAAGAHEGFGGRAFAGPVALLVGPRTLSAAEHFAAAFAFARRGPIVGEPTGGSTGHTLDVSLPGGGSVRITTTRDYYPDGTIYNGTGVPATHDVRATVDDIRAGRDPVLIAALEALAGRSVVDGPTIGHLGDRREATP
jgi:C-terminal processing protease CtpA/Prc